MRKLDAAAAEYANQAPVGDRPLAFKAFLAGARWKPEPGYYTITPERLDKVMEALDKNNVRLSDLITQDEEWELLEAMADFHTAERTRSAEKEGKS